ncbi:MAG: hypothetical protein ABH807_02815 [Candidatus Shapirobacteria bacterium]
MEVKSFFEHLKSKEEVKPEFFFVLQITAEVVKSAVWLVEEQKVKIISLGKETAWSGSEGLLAAADASLSTAVSRLNLPAGAEEPSRVIFGLPSGWAEGEKIAAERIGELKELSQKLELKPAGFVVVPEAMVHYLKTAEGVPPTAILVGVGERYLFLSLVNLGRITANEEVERSENFGADLAEGLSRCGTNCYFPPRIILYDGKGKIEDLGQELLAYSWASAGINFLHLPKVEVLGPDVDVRAVALAGGQELVQAIGVVEEGPQLVEPAAKSVDEVKTMMELVDKEEVVIKAEKKEKKWRLPRWPRPRLNWTWRFQGRALRVLEILLVVLVLVLGGLFWLYWNLSSAEVTLGVENKFLEKELTLKLDPGASESDKEKMTLPGRLVEMEAEREKGQAASGKKIIGEAAKGEARVYNNTSKEKEFAAGTLITTTSGLKFSLDEGVVIASHSSTLETVPSVVVKVTAVKFGTDYNLVAGTEFIVANLAKLDFAAKNENAFLGGSSEEVTAVAAKDREDLAKELTEEMKAEAIEGLKSKVDTNQELVEESLVMKVVSKEYDKEVDEEADRVNLKLKVKFGMLSYQKEDLKQLISEEVARLVPAGYRYQPEEAEISFTLKNLAKDGAALFNARVRAGLQPELDLNAISQNLAGKRPQLGRSYLINLPEVSRVEIAIRPRLPEKIATFPPRPERIKIHLTEK